MSRSLEFAESCCLGSAPRDLGRESVRRLAANTSERDENMRGTKEIALTWSGGAGTTPPAAIYLTVGPPAADAD